MLSAIDIFLLIVATSLCVPVAMFCLEVMLALLPRTRNELPQWPAGARLAVLIPAHNEQSMIGATLRTLMPTVPTGSRVLVVADNCSDDTATIARQCGAEAVERTDAEQRGKGFALDFGIRHLNQDPPEAVVFLDADCRVESDTVRLLGATAVAVQRPVQGLNLCDPDPNGNAPQMVSGLAFRFKNLVRTLGLERLAGLSYLTGTGMALPWPLVVQAKLADGNVVEDMQLGIDFALTGKPPLFLPEARVDSPLPQQRAAARTQRTRWEHGHLKTLLVQSPRLVGLAILHRRLDLIWLAIDLAVPPLSLLVITLAVAISICAAAWLTGCSSMPLMILVTAGTLLAASILVGWAGFCRQQVPLWAVLTAPCYAAAKLPIYLAFLIRREKHWVRTGRDIAKT